MKRKYVTHEELDERFEYWYKRLSNEFAAIAQDMMQQMDRRFQAMEKRFDESERYWKRLDGRSASAGKKLEQAGQALSPDNQAS